MFKYSQHIEEFKRDGVTVARGLLSEAYVARMRGDMETVRIGLKSGELSREGRFVSGKLPDTLKASGLPFYPELVLPVRVLLETQDVALYFSRLLLKDSSWSGAVALHQDLPYFHGGHRKLSAFVPLAPMSASDGGLCFVKGSHKFGMLERGSINREAFTSPFGVPALEDLRPDVEPGEVVFMDFLTWHYSGAGSSDRPLMQITFQPATDGSYCSSPVLICGEWQTEYFVKKGECVKPDA